MRVYVNNFSSHPKGKLLEKQIRSLGYELAPSVYQADLMFAILTRNNLTSVIEWAVADKGETREIPLVFVETARRRRILTSFQVSDSEEQEELKNILSEAVRFKKSSRRSPVTHK